MPRSMNENLLDAFHWAHHDLSMKTCIIIAALFTFMVQGASAQEKRLWAKSVINEKGPELQVEKWLTEQPDTKGKFVLIDFWATWCPPCRKAIPELNAFQAKFGDKLVVIGVSDESEDKVRKMTEPKMEYASAIDTQGRTKKLLEVKGIPHVILMDPQGIVRWEGYPLLTGHLLTEAVIEEVMKKHGGK
jgi:cytochrome c biogenesis protein CcmG/thiol:disulfide interchange protein DsbE